MEWIDGFVLGVWIVLDTIFLGLPNSTMQQQHNTDYKTLFLAYRPCSTVADAMLGRPVLGAVHVLLAIRGCLPAAQKLQSAGFVSSDPRFPYGV